MGAGDSIGAAERLIFFMFILPCDSPILDRSWGLSQPGSQQFFWRTIIVGGSIGVRKICPRWSDEIQSWKDINFPRSKIIFWGLISFEKHAGVKTRL